MQIFVTIYRSTSHLTHLPLYHTITPQLGLTHPARIFHMLNFPRWRLDHPLKGDCTLSMLYQRILVHKMILLTYMT